MQPDARVEDRVIDRLAEVRDVEVHRDDDREQDQCADDVPASHHRMRRVGWLVGRAAAPGGIARMG